MHKFNPRAFYVIIGAIAALGSCHRGEQSSTDAAGVPTASASAAIVPGAEPVATRPGLAVADGHLVLPIIAGRPGAVYFTLVNRTAGDRTLTGVTIAGASRAQMHQTSGGSMEPIDSVTVPARGDVTFAPGGRHVMVFGVPASLRPGTSVTMTLRFKDADTLEVPVKVEAGGAGDGMAGMTM